MIVGRRATTYGCHVDLSSRIGHAASEWSLFSAGVSLDGYRRGDVDMAEIQLMNVSQGSQVPELAVTAPVNLAWTAARRPKRPFIGQRRIARAWKTEYLIRPMIQLA